MSGSANNGTVSASRSANNDINIAVNPTLETAPVDDIGSFPSDQTLNPTPSNDSANPLPAVDTTNRLPADETTNLLLTYQSASPTIV